MEATIGAPIERLLKFEIKNSDTYGREYYLPKSEIGEIVCAVKKRKALNVEDIVALKNHGFRFEFTGDRSEMVDSLFPEGRVSK